MLEVYRLGLTILTGAELLKKMKNFLKQVQIIRKEDSTTIISTRSFEREKVFLSGSGSLLYIYNGFQEVFNLLEYETFIRGVFLP